MRHVMFLLAAIYLLTVSSSPLAASVQSIHVGKKGDAYDVHARVVMAVDQATAFAAATDFAKLPAYSAAIKSERLLSGDEVASKIRLCVALLCRTINQVMRYSTQPPTRLDMQVVPGAGDLKSGSVHWRFQVDGPHRTTLFFHSSVVPDFWVPPLVGPMAVEHVMKQQMIETAQAVEGLAQAKSKTGG